MAPQGVHGQKPWTEAGSQESLTIQKAHDALLAADAVLDKQAEDVRILDVRIVSGVTDYFVIATARSRPQVLAIVEHLEQAFRRAGKRVHHIEGLGAPGASRSRQPGEGFLWVLIDCGSVVVHLFHPASRDFYQLERLWADAPRIDPTV